MTSVLPIMSCSGKEATFNSYFVLLNCEYSTTDCLFLFKINWLQFLLFLHSNAVMPLPCVPSACSITIPHIPSLHFIVLQKTICKVSLPLLPSKLATEHSRRTDSNHLAENLWGNYSRIMKRTKIFQTTVLVWKILLPLLNKITLLGNVQKQ